MFSIRSFVLSIVSVLFVVTAVFIPAETFARTWKTEKSSIEGDFDSLQDNGTKVRVKRSDGKFVRVDLYKLSEEDQKYIEQNFSESDFEEEEEESTPSNNQPTVDENDSVDKVIESVNLLEKKGEYLVARQKLLNVLQEQFSEKLVDLWIQLDTKLCPSSNYYQRSLAVFTPEERTWTEYTLKNEGYQKWNFINPISMAVGKYSDDLAKKYQKERFDKDATKDFGILDKDTISKILDVYETLKKSTETLLSYLNKEMLNTEDNDLLKTLSNYSTKVKAFKSNIKTQRTNYLSYYVVSPYLADADRWLYLANEQKEWFLWPQQEALDKAIKVLSFSCHGQHLYECNEDVRQQFFEVQKKLKSMVSSTVYEELKVLTTLQDSSDSSKKRGADAWWE